jgi:glycosidase
MKNKFRWLFLLLTAYCLLLNVQAQPKIEKIEPPNWWANHTINPVRLLVRGQEFQNAKVILKNAQLKVSNLRVNKNGTYLFFDVTIPLNTKPAKYEFEVSTDKGKSLIPFEILPIPKAPTTITNDDVIYLIMPDRFANGDPSNDKDVDRNNPRMWHGGDLKGITKHIPYLKELGVTAIWLTPWYDNPDEANQCNKPWCPNANYHGYHAIDYYGVENHFGSMNDLLEMIRTCQKNGIKVIQDQVANHVGIQHPWSKNPPLENWFSPYSQNTFNNSVLLSPNASINERENLLKGWFNELLPDMNQDEPEVAKYEIQNAMWWIGMTGINGIRQDTIQYMPRKFIHDWSAAIQKQYPNYYLVGEVFEEDSTHTAFFQGGKTGWDGIDTNLPSVFDFKLWRTSQQVFTGQKPIRALRDVLKYDGLYPNINHVTVLANNHDTDRFMSLPNATKEGAKLHMAFILATRGIPQLYYGEEVLMTGGHDPDNRKDFTKFEKSSRTADEQEMFEWTQKWIKLRDNLIAQTGKTTDLFYDNEAYVFAKSKVIMDGVATLIYAFNNSDKIKEVEFINPSSRNDYKMLFVEKGTSVEIKGKNVKLMLMPKSANALSF